MNRHLQSGTLLIVFAMLITQLAACGSEETTETYVVRGEIVGILYNGLALRIDHEPIDGYMDAMRMNFRLQSPEDGHGLEPGDRIQFTYLVSPGGTYIRDIEPLPPETELDIEGIPGRTTAQDDE